MAGSSASESVTHYHPKIAPRLPSAQGAGLYVPHSARGADEGLGGRTRRASLLLTSVSSTSSVSTMADVSLQRVSSARLARPVLSLPHVRASSSFGGSPSPAPSATALRPERLPSRGPMRQPKRPPRG